ncbi:pectin acetylesterase 11-like [Salvia splendens]|nr:pectin acetylesterase 11-like [Salvia splendens]XP_042003974.1 pectin acetylesterase 11-like [Salvia splendens]
MTVRSEIHGQTTSCVTIYLGLALLASIIAQVNGQMVPLTIIDKAQEKLAICIDGTPGGYHFDPGFGDGANNWIIMLMGGGWCGLNICQYRIGKDLGSTTNIPPQNFEGILSSDQSINPDFYNWNRVFIRYCDGGSFMGDAQRDDNGHIVELRGLRVFTAVMDELLNVKGMKKTENAILAGGSAGALAAILLCDRYRALIPDAKRVKCLSQSGFFIRAKDLPDANRREGGFAHIIDFHNMIDALPKSCTSKMNASLCLFPEYVVGDVQTPLFLLNPIFDTFQLQHLVRPNPPELDGWNTTCINNSLDPSHPPCPDLTRCTPSQMQLVKDYGGALLDAINEIQDIPSRGLFLSSCYAHDFVPATWSAASYRLQDKTISQAFSDWYFDRSPAKMIDNRIDAPLKC